MLGLTTVSKPVRSSAPLAGQQFHMPHICQTWHCLTFICLGPSKKVLSEQHFSRDEEVRNEEVNRKSLKMQPIEFYNEEICVLVKRCKKSVQKAGDCIMK